MKKKLDVDMIQSELRGGSAFFPGYKGRTSHTPAPDSENTRDTVPHHEETYTGPTDGLRQDNISEKFLNSK